ncbi:hypothetical protein AMTR_s00117p00139870, partial [Amborella trichopoda]
FLPTVKNFRRKKIAKEVRAILEDMVQKREKAIKSGATNYHDLLGLLLESNNTNDNKSKMTLDDVIEECKLFYFAGHETTSMLLTWTMVVLSTHPTWQQRAREEVMQIMGSTTDPPTLDQVAHLKIVTMILYEVLRLYPPVVFLIRQTYKRVTLGGLDFPAGVRLLLPILMIHHDREIWGDDADEFRPERFLEGVSKAAKHPLAFFPFGWGPRICIGQNFALIEAKMALAMILQHFSFHLSPSYTHAPYAQLTIHPQFGAPIILEKL